MSPQNGILDKDAIDQGVHAAHAAEEYVLPDGAIDKAKVRERAFEVLRSVKVLGKREREAKAVTRGTMVERVFPHLPGPESFSEQENAYLAQAVWNEIDKFLWSLTTPSAGSGLQRLVGLNMGNGYVLCRTRVGKDRTSAVYITDNPECIELDFVLPDNQSLDRKIKTVTRNREMLVYRQPQNAKRYQRRFDSTLRQLTSAASGQLALAVESATMNGSDEPAEGDEG